MFEPLTRRLVFFSDALQLRAHRQQVLASNIANAETPGFVARDFDFRQAMDAVRVRGPELRAGSTPMLSGADARHLRTAADLSGVPQRHRVQYSVQTQPSLDGNSVDLDQQRANFVHNAVHYESTLRFINGHVRTLLSAIQGQ